MKSLVEELLWYFDNTPKKQLQNDWEAIHNEYGYGMEVQKFIECSRILLDKDSIVAKIKVDSSISEDFGKYIDLSKAA